MRLLHCLLSVCFALGLSQAEASQYPWTKFIGGHLKFCDASKACVQGEFKGIQTNSTTAHQEVVLMVSGARKTYPLIAVDPATIEMKYPPQAEKKDNLTKLQQAIQSGDKDLLKEQAAQDFEAFKKKVFEKNSKIPPEPTSPRDQAILKEIDKTNAGLKDLNSYLEYRDAYTRMAVLAHKIEDGTNRRFWYFKYLAISKLGSFAINLTKKVGKRLPRLPAETGSDPKSNDSKSVKINTDENEIRTFSKEPHEDLSPQDPESSGAGSTAKEAK